MAPKGMRRGVLMTATARKTRASWRDEENEDSDGIPESDDDDVAAAKASQLEWETITREVRDDRRKKHAETHFAMGKRDDVAGYDDVAEDAIEPEVPRLPPRDDDGNEPADTPEATSVVAAGAEGGSARVAAPEAPAAGSTVSAEGAAGDAPAAGDRGLPPEGAITAGQQEDKAKKVRGGKKKTGSQKKRERAEVEGGDGEGKKRRRKDGEDKDDGKWLKCKLEGDEKTKRIKASRLVYYHDFDSGGALFRGEAAGSTPGAASSAATVAEPSAHSAAQEAAGSSTAAASPAAAAGNFRSRLRLDLWDDDSEE